VPRSARIAEVGLEGILGALIEVGQARQVQMQAEVLEAERPLWADQDQAVLSLNWAYTGPIARAIAARPCLVGQRRSFPAGDDQAPPRAWLFRLRSPVWAARLEHLREASLQALTRSSREDAASTVGPGVAQGHRGALGLDDRLVMGVDQEVARSAGLPGEGDTLRSAREPLQGQPAEGIEVFRETEEFA